MWNCSSHVHAGATVHVVASWCTWVQSGCWVGCWIYTQGTNTSAREIKSSAQILFSLPWLLTRLYHWTIFFSGNYEKLSEKWQWCNVDLIKTKKLNYVCTSAQTEPITAIRVLGYICDELPQAVMSVLRWEKDIFDFLLSAHWPLCCTAAMHLHILAVNLTLAVQLQALFPVFLSHTCSRSKVVCTLK